MLISVVLFFILLRLLLAPMPIPADNSMYLHMGEMISRGLLPYVDFTDINPPLIMYVGLAPAVIMKIFGCSADNAIKIFVFIIIALFSFLLNHIASLARDTEAYQPLNWLSLCFPIICCSLPDAFGHKGQFFLLALIPYLVWRWLEETKGLSRLSLSLVTGASAGFTVCFKPHFLLVILACDLYYCLLKKKLVIFTPTIYSIAIAPILYVLHFCFLPAAVRHAFFQDQIPIIIGGYNAYKPELLEVILGTNALGYIFALTLTLVLALALHKKCSLMVPVWIACAAALILIWMQYSLWLANAAPFLGLLLSLIVLLCSVLYNRPITLPVPIKLLCAAFAISITFLPNVIWSAIGRDQVNPLADVMQRNTSRGDKVIIASTRLHYSYPLLLDLGLEPGTRYTYLFAIPMIEYNKQHSNNALLDQKLEAEENLICQNFFADIRNTKPVLIALENENSVGLAKTPLAQILRNGPLQKYLQTNYVCLQKNLGPFEVWQKYQQNKLDQKLAPADKDLMDKGPASF